MDNPTQHVYSKRRLRITLALLTLATLPIVIGVSTLAYYYLRFSVLVERRLEGERSMIPSRVYARPLTLRESSPFTPERLLRTLNGLKYEELTGTTTPGAGQFVTDGAAVAFGPRPVPGATGEPVFVSFEKERIKEIRGLGSKRRYKEVTLEPELMTFLFDESREKRRRVSYEELPQHLVWAVVAIEDRRFFVHPGLDPLGIVGAVVKNIRAESYVRGGSTITQQLCKNFFLTPERTFRRKIQEAILALVLERRADKKDILELYLNEIYLGQSGSFSINGVGEAARMYFQKDVSNLTMSEAALLAGMIQSPNPYNPNRHPERAVERRNVVIRAMNEAGFIDDATRDATLAAPLTVASTERQLADAPYFVDLVRTQLAQRYEGNDLTTGNLAIRTSLDLHLQELATAALGKGLADAEKLIRKKRTDAPLQGCLIAIEASSGQVVALAGGRSYGRSQYNRVTQARRQPGSTFKPFVYLAAFEAGLEDPALPPLTPATVVEDSPSVFFYEDKEYIPQNYEDEYLGYVTLRRALAMSLNVATVKVAEMIGFDRVADLWSKKLAIGAEIQPYPAVALGSFEATPYQMATAYTILANYGRRIEPVTVMSVLDAKGQALEEHARREAPQVVSEAATFLVVNMMRSVLNEGTAGGARRLGFTADAAGKTGTTNDMRDAWFAGFTPELVCVVWVGYDDNTPVGLSGARAALPIWVDFMNAALAGTKPTPFRPPDTNVIFVDIDKETGLLATPYCPKVISEAFIPSTEPMERCSLHR